MRIATQRAVSIFLIFVLALAWATPAFAATGEEACNTAGGVWKSHDSANGKCIYAKGSTTALTECGDALHEYRVTYVANAEYSNKCVLIGSRVTTDGAKSEATTLRIKNAKVTFAAGTCKRNCSISADLPALPKSSILLTPLATLYVRSGSANGLYQVCFKNTTRGSVRIYRYRDGLWVPISAVSSAMQVCANASGDGSFYLH